MKRKALFLVAFVVMCVSLVATLSIGVLAADEEIVVGYYETQSGSMKEKAVPNADGTYTMRATQFSKDSSVNLTNGAVSRELYGWFTEEGDFYTPGQTVTFTKSTKLFQAFGVTVYTFEDLKKAFSAGGWVRLGCDLEGDCALTNGEVTTVLDLNGYNYTCTNNQNASWGAWLGVFGAKRGSYAIMGSGTITQGVRTKDNNNGKFFAEFETHGYADENNPQDFWIGKDVKIVTPYPLLNIKNQPKLGMPDIKIAGTIEASQLLIGPSMREGYLEIFESADITLTGKEMVTITALDTNQNVYLTVNIYGGTIRMGSDDSKIITEAMTRCCKINVLGGNFIVSDEGEALIQKYIPTGLELTETTIEGASYTTVSLSACQHNYVLDESASVVATKANNGKDVFVCSFCGTIKEEITVYNPAYTEITIKVLVGEDVTTKVVTLGSVATIEKFGIDENAFYAVTVINETDSEGNKIVAIQIPFGVSRLNLSVKNRYLEQIEFLDEANLRVNCLEVMEGLKQLKIGASTVVFASNCLSNSNKAFYSIVSDKVGANVTFEKQAMYYHDTCIVKELILSNGSTYNFGESSFKKSQIETLNFPDGAVVTFTGAAAFESSSKLKYIYLGDGVTSISDRSFDYLNSLECVVVMNASVIGDCAFRVSGGESATTELSVYVHTADVTTIHKNAFSNRSNYGVRFYTIDPDITKLENCLYTVYNGIPHGYADGVVREATCIEPGIVGSITDCACSVNSVVTYTIYTAEGTETGTTAQRETELSTVHVLGTKVSNINYKNGYLEAGTKEYFCALCGVATVEEETPSAQAMFECLGYSASETTEDGIVIGYKINRVAIEVFESTSGVTVSYGVFAVAQKKLGTNDVFDGNGAASEGVLYAKTSIYAFDFFELKLVGFVTEEQKESKIAIGAYVIAERAGEKEISYIQTNKVADGEKYYFTSYAEMRETVK